MARAPIDELRECSDCGQVFSEGGELAPHDCDGSEILDREFHRATHSHSSARTSNRIEKPDGI